jgi:hypothetical protein
MVNLKKVIIDEKLIKQVIGEQFMEKEKKGGKIQRHITEYLGLNTSGKTVEEVTAYVETLNVSKATGEALKTNVYIILNRGCNKGVYEKTITRPKKYTLKSGGVVSVSEGPVGEMAQFADGQTVDHVPMSDIIPEAATIEA